MFQNKKSRLKNCLLNFYLLLTLSMFLSCSSLLSTEEKNSTPFYHFRNYKIKMDLAPNSGKICRVSSREIVFYSKYKIKECYDFSSKLSTILEQAIKDNPSKKEIILMIFDSGNKQMVPKITTSEGIFNLQTIIYMQNDKTTHLELIDEKNKYYFFTVNPKQVFITQQ